MTSADRPHRGRRTIRLRIARADPWSVMTTSCLLLVGLGICVLLTMTAVWVVLSLLDPDAWPSFGSTLTIAAGVVTLEVILGTALATLGAFLYNLSSQYAGGVHLTLADDIAAAEAAGAALLPDVGRLYRRLQARLGFPPPGWGARYVDFADRCAATGRRLRRTRRPGSLRPDERSCPTGRTDRDHQSGRDDPDSRVKGTVSG
ncbi:DUF3566 domain-containing protein [Streptomyces thermoalcalitolerans]|uniref:DUF3566 domain-containing protein n=1 Tax=Streptomyces thermoalcalitolerans TaxID=65605 RepID=A0ABP3ZIA8_9ACTN